MSSTASPDPGKDLVELTPVFRGGKDIQRKSPKVYDSELCMLALPPGEHQLLTRVTQYLFSHGIIPVVVKSPTEALIHSRHSKFAVIALPDSDPALIRKVRSTDGINCQTPVIVISVADIIPESTLHMLGRNEIQEAIHRTSDPEKFENDLITALSHFMGQTHHTVDHGLSMLPMPVPIHWSTAPLQYTSAPVPPFEHPEGTGLKTPLINYVPRKPILSEIQDLSNEGLVDQVQEAGNLLVSGQTVTQVVKEGSATPKVPLALGLSTQENSEAVLPGIETLLNAIQVVEGESPAGNSEAPCFTKIIALNAPDCPKSRSCSLVRRRRTRRSSTESQPSDKTTNLDTEAEDSLSDSKNPLPACLAEKKPYFLSLDSYREALADDPDANPVDRHNSKERHRRIRITKAAEFFKAAIPGMEPNMDKATAFHLTVQYMVFLRNALRQQDPTVIPKLHETFKQEWSEVFNMNTPSDAE
ncbi:uncharacterized protein LOC111340261 [Stylophora pistillata]|uniref:BHLH domain-containing protein n=1 Tax=Stylophora pistillata TaxID=50429 RepID=A0A2B4SWP7_STYPI|nr:uncharacterized protein LOC111340261 [Stylophora pistillata]PFX33290.1 hypothetical protein AWC38_SpisGene1794 [Stylophora pistillata]